MKGDGYIFGEKLWLRWPGQEKGRGTDRAEQVLYVDDLGEGMSSVVKLETKSIHNVSNDRLQRGRTGPRFPVSLRLKEVNQDDPSVGPWVLEARRSTRWGFVADFFEKEEAVPVLAALRNVLRIVYARVVEASVPKELRGGPYRDEEDD